MSYGLFSLPSPFVYVIPVFNVITGLLLFDVALLNVYFNKPGPLYPIAPPSFVPYPTRTTCR